MADHGYDRLTVVQLKKECRSRNIRGYSKLRKDQLVELLFDNDIAVERSMEDGKDNRDVKTDDRKTIQRPIRRPIQRKVKRKYDSVHLQEFQPEDVDLFEEHLGTMSIDFAPSVKNEHEKWILLEIFRRHVTMCIAYYQTVQERKWKVRSSKYMGRPFYTIKCVTTYLSKKTKAVTELSQGVVFRVEQDTLDVYRSSGTIPLWNLKTHRPRGTIYQSLGLIPDWLEEKDEVEAVTPIVQEPPLTVQEIFDTYHSNTGVEQDEADVQTIKDLTNIEFDPSVTNSARRLIALLLLRSTANRIHEGRSQLTQPSQYHVVTGIYLGDNFYRITERSVFIHRSVAFRIKMDTLEFYAPSGRVPILNLSDDEYGMDHIGDILRPHKKHYQVYVDDSHFLWERLGLYNQTLTKGITKGIP